MKMAHTASERGIDLGLYHIALSEQAILTALFAVF